MNYNVAKNECLKQIREHNIIELYAIPSRVACLTVEIIDELNLAEDIDIINAIKQQKAVIYQDLLDKWLNSDKPQLQIAAMKLVASEQNRANLTGMETPSVSDKGNKTPQITIRTVTKKEEVNQAPKSVPATPAPTKQGRRKK
jgi:hypothetical protein